MENKLLKSDELSITDEYRKQQAEKAFIELASKVDELVFNNHYESLNLGEYMLRIIG